MGRSVTPAAIAGVIPMLRCGRHDRLGALPAPVATLPSRGARNPLGGKLTTGHFMCSKTGHFYLSATRQQ